MGINWQISPNIKLLSLVQNQAIHVHVHVYSQELRRMTIINGVGGVSGDNEENWFLINLQRERERG